MIPGDEKAHAQMVREMFGSIARRYDFLNHFLSGNIDQHWRRVCVWEVEKRLAARKPRILDVGCGTADLSLAFSRLGPVVGCDFCHPMLVIGRRKSAGAGSAYQVDLSEGDALCLPFSDYSFDAVVSAFLVRNLSSLEKGLEEMRRVLRPGGVLGILDFAMPSVPLLGGVYRVYLTKILPKLGRLISGVNGPYDYLADSVRSFPPPEQLRRLLRDLGFAEVEFYLLTGGIAVLHLAQKS